MSYANSPSVAGGSEYYQAGGLFDEFLQLQPAQLSWGGVVSVLSSLIQSHGTCLERLSKVEEAVHDLRSTVETGANRGGGGGGGGSAGDSAASASLRQLERQVSANTTDIGALYSAMEVDRRELDQALQQAEMEGIGGHSKVKLLHSLPAFATLIEDIRDVLVPLSAGGGGGGGGGGVPPPVATGSPTDFSAFSDFQNKTPTSRHGSSNGRHDYHRVGDPMEGSALHTGGNPVAMMPPPVTAAAAAPAAPGKPMVGLEIIDSIPDSLDPLSSSGVRVFAVRPDGPAAAAGVRNGDCIVALNDRPVQTRGDLKTVMSSCRPNDIVKVELLRQDVSEPLVVHIRLGTAPGSADLASPTSGRRAGHR